MGVKGSACAGLLEGWRKEPWRLRVAGPPAAGVQGATTSQAQLMRSGEKRCQKLGNEADALAHGGAACSRGCGLSRAVLKILLGQGRLQQGFRFLRAVLGAGVGMTGPGWAWLGKPDAC